MLNLDDITLKTLCYFKGQMIKDSKELDTHKTGSISKDEAIAMLINNFPDINHNLAQQIVEYYFISDQIDYMKFIAFLVKNNKNCFIKKKNYFNFKKYFISNKNNNFSNSNNNFYKNSLFNKKINLKKNVIIKQKDKKFPIINETEKEMEKKNEKENENYNDDEDEEEILFADKQRTIERNKKELLFISGLIPEIKNKYETTLDQNINTGELMRIFKIYWN